MHSIFSFANEWANLISVGQVIAGIIGGIWASTFGGRWPHRRLWSFNTEHNLAICVATSAMVDTGRYHRPTTGIGQVRALSDLMPSLQKAHPSRLRCETFFSSEFPARHWRDNIISLGGPKNNSFTKELLSHLTPVSGVSYADDLNTIIHNGATYRSDVQDGEIILDYGLIISAPNPLSEGKSRIVVLAGSSTVGTSVAAKYFLQCRGAFPFAGNRGRAIIIEARVSGGEISSLKKLRDFRFDI